MRFLSDKPDLPKPQIDESDRETNTLYFITKTVGQGSCHAASDAWIKENNSYKQCVVLDRRVRNEMTVNSPAEAYALLNDIQSELIMRPIAYYQTVETDQYGDKKIIAGSLLVERVASRGSIIDDFNRFSGDPLRKKIFLKQLVEGLQSIHAAGIAHRDINPSNVMFSTEKEHPMYIDFSIAQKSSTQLSPLGIPVGTANWVGYEMCPGQNPPDTNPFILDIAALGLLFSTLLGLRHPCTRTFSLPQCSLSLEIVMPCSLRIRKIKRTQIYRQSSNSFWT